MNEPHSPPPPNEDEVNHSPLVSLKSGLIHRVVGSTSWTVVFDTVELEPGYYVGTDA